MIGKAQRDVVVGKQFQDRSFEPAGVSELKSITSARFKQLDEFAEPARNRQQAGLAIEIISDRLLAQERGDGSPLMPDCCVNYFPVASSA